MFSIFRRKAPPLPQAPLIVAPRLKTANFAAAVRSIPGMTEASMPIVEPAFGDLYLTYAMDIGESYVSVTQSTLKEHNIGNEELRRLANATALRVLSTARVGTDGVLFEITADENMAACSALFMEMWDQIESELGGPIVAAFPHRDFALYTRADNPEGVEKLRAHVEKMDFNETHALSSQLYGRSSGAWEPRS